MRTPYGPGSPPALVLGRGVTSLGVIRSLGRLGIETFLVGDEGFATRSRWYRPLNPPGLDPPTEATLAEWLRRLPFERMALVPCSDEWATAVSLLEQDLAARFPSSLAPAAALAALVDKGRFAEVLDALALPHPRTLRLRRAAELQAVGEDLLSSAFLKPRESQAFARRFGVKAFHFRTRAEALARLQEAQTAGFEMLLQEYIPGPPTAHFFIDGFVDSRAEVRARFARQRLRMDPPDFGNSSAMVSIPPRQAEDAVATSDALLAHLAYRGIFSAEFKLDARDGRFKILEVNSRAWWFVEFATDCGVNVCEMAYRDALGLPVPAVERYAVGKRCVFPYHDLRAWRRAKHGGRPALLRLLASWTLARQPIFRWDDPLPALASAARYWREKLRRSWRGGSD
jgi:predicted ATP-grasp superfamily ATP-dependent carboligase